MLSASINEFSRNTFGYVEQAVRFSQIVSVTTDAGSAVLIGQKDFNALMETAYLFSHPGTARDILDGLETPWEDCVSAGEVFAS